VIAVDQLAFYQSGSFGVSSRQINYFAKVRGHELTTRSELLKDETSHPRANEEYYKIQLGELEQLSPPIIAGRWKRLTFLYTTGEYLLKAKTLKDLVVKPDERTVLWRSLHERAVKDQLYKADLPEANIPPELLVKLLGINECPDSHNHLDLD
jgi:hypothetical protein